MASQNSRPETETEEDRIQSIDSLAQRQDRTETKLDQILSMLGGGGRAASRDDEGDLGSRPDIASQVRAELQRARQEDQAAAAGEKQRSEAEELRARLAKLEEVKPEPPQPRRQRIMWGPR